MLCSLRWPARSSLGRCCLRFVQRSRFQPSSLAKARAGLGPVNSFPPAPVSSLPSLQSPLWHVPYAFHALSGDGYWLLDHKHASLSRSTALEVIEVDAGCKPAGVQGNPMAAGDKWPLGRDGHLPAEDIIHCQGHRGRLRQGERDGGLLGARAITGFG